MEAINVLFSPAYYQYTMLTLSVFATIALSLPLMVAYIDHYYDKKDKQTEFTIKPVNDDHPSGPEIVAAVDRWSLFRGKFIL